MSPIDNTAQSHPVRYKLRLHYARLYAGDIVDLQSKLSCRSCLNVPISGTKELASRTTNIVWRTRSDTFVLFPLLELTRAVAQHHAGFVFKITIVRKNHRAGRPRPYGYLRLTAARVVDLQANSLIVHRCSLIVFYINNVFFRIKIENKQKKHYFCLIFVVAGSTRPCVEFRVGNKR